MVVFTVALTVPGPRPPGLVLRHSPEGEELRNVGEVGQGVQARRREAQVPADLLVQQPGEVVGALRRVLPGLQGAGHGARAGAQGRREEAAQGDIRRDARPGALPGVAPTADKTIGTPNDYFPRAYSLPLVKHHLFKRNSLNPSTFVSV